MGELKTPTLNSLNNSIIVRQTKFDPSKFTDLNWLYTNYTKDSLTVYKGLLSLWNQRSIINTPLINMTELQNNVMYIPNTEGRFRYSIPYDLGLPYIVEDVESDNEKPGLDGQPFRIKLSENCYTNTDKIIADFRDGIELYITEEEIQEEADGWVYTVQVVSKNRKKTFYPKEWLQPGIQYEKTSNVNGEYDTEKSSISSFRTGFMDLEMELGGGHRSVTHWITGYADMARIDENKAPQLAYINQRLEGMGSTILYANPTVDGRTIDINKPITWQSTIEVLLRAEMELMTEKDLMWSKGGVVEGLGRRKVRVGTGLYEQLRNGNRYVYNTISLELIERAVANLFSKSGIPIEQRRTKIMTGTGGLIQVSKEIQDKFKQSVPFLTNTGDVPGGVFFGDGMNLGFKYRFTQFYSPVAGLIQFEVNPALDNLNSNRIQDSFIGEYPIESYTYMIMDITDGAASNAAARVGKNVQYRVDNGFNTGANIVLVKPQNYGELYWGYIAGTQHPLGPASMKGMYSANNFDGYQIWMKSFSNLWVKDVTRTLIIEKARPSFTGLVV